MKLRHELKHEIDYADLLALRMRLGAVLQPDPHAKEGKYHIRSLYFDDLLDTALREKQSGISRREKFRIRYYDGDTSRLHLEKKIKQGGLGCKLSAPLTTEEGAAIVRGEIDWMTSDARPTVQELGCRMQTQGLRPRTIVDYTREPFIYGPGNVRVTLDYDIRTGLRHTDFLDPTCVTVPVGVGLIILEVKWDAYLPDIVRDLIQLPARRTGAYSKYAACRIYG